MRIAVSTSPGTDSASIIARSSLAAVSSSATSSMSTAVSLAWIRSRSPPVSQKDAYAGAPTTNPDGTGIPARMSSPRFAPFPPAEPTASRPRAAKVGRARCRGLTGPSLSRPPEAIRHARRGDRTGYASPRSCLFAAVVAEVLQKSTTHVTGAWPGCAGDDTVEELDGPDFTGLAVMRENWCVRM